jgi:hypothetical protein
MLTMRLLIGLGIVAVTTPVLCAQFFIVQDLGTNRCTIAEQSPVRGAGPSNPLPTNPPYPTPSQESQPTPMSTEAVVGDGAYGDRATAEADMRVIAACAETRQ